MDGLVLSLWLSLVNTFSHSNDGSIFVALIVGENRSTEKKFHQFLTTSFERYGKS